MKQRIPIRVFNDAESIRQYRILRWEAFRKSSNLPLGSEYYEGEENGVYVGAFDGDTCVGGVFLIDRNNHVGQMHQLVVAEKYRQKGLGKLLISELERIARNQGYAVLYAHARAFLQQFYEHLGYVLIDEGQSVPSTISHVHQPGVPHVLMVKRL